MSVAISAAVGAGVEVIDAPALVLDLGATERNLAAMAAFARGHGVRLRRHAKMSCCLGAGRAGRRQAWPVARSGCSVPLRRR